MDYDLYFSPLSVGIYRNMIITGELLQTEMWCWEDFRKHFQTSFRSTSASLRHCNTPQFLLTNTPHLSPRTSVESAHHVLYMVGFLAWGNIMLWTPFSWFHCEFLKPVIQNVCNQNSGFFSRRKKTSLNSLWRLWPTKNSLQMRLNTLFWAVHSFRG